MIEQNNHWTSTTIPRVVNNISQHVNNDTTGVENIRKIPVAKENLK